MGLGVNELKGRSSGELSDLSKLSNDDLLRSLTHPLLDQRIVDIDLERRLLSSHSVAMIIASVEYHCHFQELSEKKIPEKILLHGRSLLRYFREAFENANVW